MHARLSLRTFLPAVLVLLAAYPGAARAAKAGEAADPATWPEFHGPGRTNISPETGLLKKWPNDGPPLVWKFSHCGQGYSGVAIAEGKIFTAGDFDDEEMLAGPGPRRPAAVENAQRPGLERRQPRLADHPTYCDGTLYHMNPHGRLAAFAAASGRELWAVDLKARSTPNTASGPSPKT